MKDKLDINYTMINENVSNYMSSLSVNSPDFSIKKLKEELTKTIGQEPAIEIKRKKVSNPINEFVKNVNGKEIHPTEEIEEIYIYYVDMENYKPIKIRMMYN